MPLFSSGAKAGNWPSWPFVRRSMGQRPGTAMPAARVAPAEPPQAHEALDGGIRVLVVDDTPVNLMVTSELLSRCGVQPLLASSGAQAVALAGEHKLDLILMDLQMPVVDGFAATRQIRREERERSRRRVPVLAFSTSAATDAVLGDSGLDGLLKKPCEPADLRACLLRWCPAWTGAAAEPLPHAR